MPSMNVRTVADFLADDTRDLVLLDVRSVVEHLEAHIPGSRLMPLDTLHRELHRLAQGPLYIVYCMTGRRSREACNILCGRGLDACHLEGGIIEWLERGYEVVSG